MHENTMQTLGGKDENWKQKEQGKKATCSAGLWICFKGWKWAIKYLEGFPGARLVRWWNRKKL